VASLIAGAVAVMVLIMAGVGVLCWALGVAVAGPGPMAGGPVSLPWSEHASSILGGVGVATSVLGFAAVVTREAWFCAADIGDWILGRSVAMGVTPSERLNQASPGQ